MPRVMWVWGGGPPFVAFPGAHVARPGRGCTGPTDWYDLHHPSRHALQHTMLESGRTPGPLAGPGSFVVTG